MHKTRLFVHEGGQAATLPEELAYSDDNLELEIERVGDEIRIRPARRSLAGVLSKFADFSPEFMSDGRNEDEQSDRSVP